MEENPLLLQTTVLPTPRVYPKKEKSIEFFPDRGTGSWRNSSSERNHTGTHFFVSLYSFPHDVLMVSVGCA